MSKSKSPSTNGSNGATRERLTNGRFAKGNKGGPGNPHAQRVARFRSILLDAVTDEDLRAIVKMLVTQAKAGEAAAARELLDRLVGKPSVLLDPERVELEHRKLALEEDRLEELTISNLERVPLYNGKIR